MTNRFAKIAAISFLALGAAMTAANAGCEGRKTTGTLIGAGAGGLLGNAVTHGSAVGTIGGAVVGGVAGHSIAADNCRGHYYYRHHHHHGYYDNDRRWHDDDQR
ncbi:MAG TPA: glycine zipper 2TM domain-containing protein [Rhizomicrobium sp.]|nr:glycine zipper 2TM domain-containing protein [Rhizomicrobium sp.]